MLECKTVLQVAKAVSKLTNTRVCKEDWIEYCKQIKKQGGTDTIDFFKFDEDGNEYDCSIVLGYTNGLYYVDIVDM